MQRESILSVYKLSDEEKKKMMDDIEYFFKDVRDEKIGIVASQQLLDFFLESLGKNIYNKALDDVHKWYKGMADNIESDFFTLYKEER